MATITHNDNATVTVANEKIAVTIPASDFIEIAGIAKQRVLSKAMEILGNQYESRSGSLDKKQSEWLSHISRVEDYAKSCQHISVRKRNEILNTAGLLRYIENIKTRYRARYNKSCWDIEILRPDLMPEQIGFCDFIPDSTLFKIKQERLVFDDPIPF